MSSAKTLRWLHIIDLLASNRRGLTAPELHSRLKEDCDRYATIDLRTVQRDLADMDASGVIRFITLPSEGKAQRWALQGDGFWNRALSPHSASTLKLVLRHMKGLLPPSAYATLQAQEHQADQMLAFSQAAEHGRRPWEQKLRVLPAGHNLQAPNLSEPVLAAIYDALVQERQLRASYRRPASESVSTRDYNVLALLVRAPKYQLLVSTDRDPYVLNVHRILGAQLLDTPTRWPNNFDVDVWVATGAADTRIGLDEPQQLHLHTTLALADHWRETPLAEAQQIIEVDGFAELTANLILTDALRRYLLGLGDQVTILAPEVLREWMAAQAQSLAEQYTALRYDAQCTRDEGPLAACRT